MRFRELFVAVVLLVAIGGLVYVLGSDGYPGAVNECVARADCYCETVRDGRVAQPANAWSNAGFVLVGLWVLFDLERRRSRGESGGWLDYAGLYGAIGIFLGVGSWLFHGTMRAWGGSFDLLSMYAFIGFAIAYGIARIAARTAVFHLVYWPLVGILGVTAFVVPQRFGKFFFAGAIAIALIIEVLVDRPEWRRRAPQVLVSKRAPWFWAGLATFVIAWILWNLSRTGAPLCWPDSWLQGHAGWHLLTAGSVACFAAYWSAHPPSSDTRISGEPLNG